MSKKTENIGFRQTPEEKAQLIEIAREMEMTPGSLASSVISRFLKAKAEHGNRLVWPPEFNYFPKGSSKQDLLLADEDRHFLKDRDKGLFLKDEDKNDP